MSSTGDILAGETAGEEPITWIVLPEFLAVDLADVAKLSSLGEVFGIDLVRIGVNFRIEVFAYGQSGVTGRQSETADSAE